MRRKVHKARGYFDWIGRNELRPYRGFAFLLPLSSFLFPLSPSFAQELQTKLELRFTTALSISSAVPPSALWGVGAHLEGQYDLEGIRLNLVLDPGVNFAQTITTDAGLTEAYGLYRLGEFDFSVGVERLPLETARLSLPFGIEPLSQMGNRQGRLGARISWNPEATRIRLAVMEDTGRLLGVLSLRREFGDFELEAHALYRSDKVLVGFGGSGTFADLVLYGEVWALGYPIDWRYALGLSGSLGDGIWTLEGGYAPASVLQLPQTFLAAQWNAPLGEDSSWSLVGRLFVDGQPGGQLVAGYSTTLNGDLIETVLAAQFTAQQMGLRLSTNVRSYLN